MLPCHNKTKGYMNAHFFNRVHYASIKFQSLFDGLPPIPLHPVHSPTPTIYDTHSSIQTDVPAFNMGLSPKELLIPISRDPIWAPLVGNLHVPCGTHHSAHACCIPHHTHHIPIFHGLMKLPDDTVKHTLHSPSAAIRKTLRLLPLLCGVAPKANPGLRRWRNICRSIPQPVQLTQNCHNAAPNNGGEV